MFAPTLLTALLLTGFGITAAAAQTSGSYGSTPSTGPASGSSGTTRATTITPGLSARPGERGLPSSIGQSGEAGGRPMDLTGSRTARELRDRRPDSLDRTRGQPSGSRGRNFSNSSVDRYPTSRMLPVRPGSAEEGERERLKGPPGLPDEASRSAAQRRAIGRRTGAGYTQRECEQIYDSGTGMTRQQWSDSCRRVGQRNERLQIR
ncbi:hypothetical protein ACO2I3_11760 [Leptospira interrogans]